MLGVLGIGLVCSGSFVYGWVLSLIGWVVLGFGGDLRVCCFVYYVLVVGWVCFVWWVRLLFLGLVFGICYCGFVFGFCFCICFGF